MGRKPQEKDLLLPFEKEKFEGEYKQYFKTKRNNFLATVQEFPMIWDCFQSLDKIWTHDFETSRLIHEARLALPALLCINAHAQFRVAFELGFSTCIAEGWNILRSAIEFVVHAHKLSREPKLQKVWLDKSEGAKQKKAYKRAFEDKKKASLFPSQYGLGDLYRYWSDYSEIGTHSSMNAIALRFQEVKRTEESDWKINYFEADLERLAIFLFSMVNAANSMEKVCFSIFENRLKLDYKLTKRRDDFEKLRQATSQQIIQRFRLAPPAIWP